MDTVLESLPKDIKQLQTLLLEERDLAAKKIERQQRALKEKQRTLKTKDAEIDALKAQNQYLLEQFRLAR